MGSTFNPHILVDKLAKLNNSQTSIETLSHWCIFHMNKAKQVVETWNRQFHSAPRDQRLTFLYLANDILQNSRRKGSEFVGEFWRVLPGALRDVIDNGDDFGRNAAFRLIAIWEERKVFGSRAQNLKDEFIRRHAENSHRNGKPPQLKLRPSAGNSMEKIVSGYQVIYGGQIDEDVMLSKCRTAISSVEKVDGETAGGSNSGQVNGSAYVEELQGQRAVLRECIDQLTTIESSRSNLVSYLRTALQEEEFKLDQVRNQIQAARVQSEHATSMCQLLANSSGQSATEQSLKDSNPSMAPSSFTGDQQAPAIYAQQQGPYSEKPDHIEEDQRKSAAAAVAAKLTASTSSAQMLSYVLSSLASEGVIGNPVKEYSGAYPPSEKRTKLEDDQSSYIPKNPPPPPPYSNPEPVQHNVSATNQQSTANEPTPPSSSPPPLPPLPSVPQYPMAPYMQSAGPLTSMHYSYSMSQQPPSSVPDYPAVAPANNIPQFVQPPVTAYQGFQASEGSYYSQPSSMPVVPISRQ